jgi:hypothetical protein
LSRRSREDQENTKVRFLLNASILEKWDTLLLNDLMQKIEIVMINNTLASKITIRERLKREESSTNKRIIFIPMRTKTLLMIVRVKHKIFHAWP